MKTMLRTAAIAVALTLAGAASAQQASQARAPRLGIGIGLPTSELGALIAGGGTSGIAPQIYVPINVTPKLRVEPQIGILTLNEDSGTDSSFFSLGAGAFYAMDLGDRALLYVGPRLILGFFNSKEPFGGGVTAKTSRTDWYIGAALGGEAFLHPRLSLGGEAQLGRWGIGDEETKVPGFPTDTQPGGSSVQTQGVIFVRVYLM